MADQNRPNVIVFFTDQQRWDSTGAHGNPLELTPNFDRIAQQGTHLHNCVTPQPVCGPARACFQTGQYASTHGGMWNGNAKVPDSSPKLAECFKQAGYRTGYIGKWHLGDQRGGPVSKDWRGGYEDWLASNILEFTSDAYGTKVWDGEDNEHRLPGYRVDALTDAAVRYIDEHQNDPFFLFVSYIEPHFQNHADDYPAPTGYEQRYHDRWVPPDLAMLGGSTHRHLGGYWGMVKRLDEAYGRMLDALYSLGLDENTIVLFTSDHGCHFKTRNSEYKRSPHESSVRIPTAICGPGFEGGGQIRQPTSLLDFAPTLLDAAGIDVPEAMEGRSIMPLIRRQTEGWPEASFFQYSEEVSGRGIRTNRWKYAIEVPGNSGGVFQGEKYVEAHLYDLERDPYELDNKIDIKAYRDKADEMRAKLLDWIEHVEGYRPTVHEPEQYRDLGQRRIELVDVGGRGEHQR